MSQSYTLELTRPRLGYHVAIAIPARNEAANIGACLVAVDLAAARSGANSTIVIVLVNNSSDDTARLARRVVTHSCKVVVEEVILSPAHAGVARSAALEIAVGELPSDGIVMTTDADSEVAPDWIAANLAEIEAGADAVAGVVTFSPATRASLPAFASDRGLEWRLADLQARLGTLLDPLLMILGQTTSGPGAPAWLPRQQPIAQLAGSPRSP